MIYILVGFVAFLTLVAFVSWAVYQEEKDDRAAMEQNPLEVFKLAIAIWAMGAGIIASVYFATHT
jgi:hypothetical protein